MGLTTNTMGSSKSFGFSRGRKKVLTTYTFPAGTSTWTAPGGVTSLTSAVGKGANGSAPFTQYGQWIWSSIHLGDNNSSPASGTTLDWSTIYSKANSKLSAASAGGTLTLKDSYYAVGTTNYSSYLTEYNSTKTISGSVSLVVSGNPKTSGQVLYSEYPYSSGWNGWYISANVLNAGTTGNNTTGFGYTFPGGSQTAATNTTYNNIGVSPGSQYSINNNGSLTIEYYV